MQCCDEANHLERHCVARKKLEQNPSAGCNSEENAKYLLMIIKTWGGVDANS